VSIVLFGIPNCDTVKRARAWLAERGAEVRFHDFKKDSVPTQALPQWLAAAGRDVLVNRKGSTWRKLTEADKALAETDVGAMALMAAQPSVIKRPVVVWHDGLVTVGFDAQQWAGRLAAGD
jgi:arsenate reductase (glutaredoxin)